jgi:hypothetical protein
MNSVVMNFASQASFARSSTAAGAFLVPTGLVASPKFAAEIRLTHATLVPPSQVS